MFLYVEVIVVYMEDTRKKQYTTECNEKCDYTKVVNCLKTVLITNDGCYAHCKHSYYTKYVGMTCDNDKCINRSMYEIDWDRLYKDYDINHKNFK